MTQSELMKYNALTDAIPGAGIDLHHRPGVPMETVPTPAGNAHWSKPEQQAATVRVLKRTSLDELTPVFSNANPPKGLSGLIRRLAYSIPEHKVRHWALLLLGDRVDVLEHRVVQSLPFVVPAMALGAVIGVVAVHHHHRYR